MEIKLNGTQIKMLEKIKNRTYYVEELSKELQFSYDYIAHKIMEMKKLGLITDIMEKGQRGRKNLSLTKRGLLILKIIQRKKSLIAKADAWLEEKFTQLGVEFDKKFKI